MMRKGAIDVISTCSGLAAIGAEWNALADSVPNPLVRHEWISACAAAFAAEAELAIFVARDASGLRAIAPLVVDRSRGAARLCLLGHQTREPEAFVHDDDTALTEVCAAVLRAGLPVVLPRLGSEAPEFRLLSRGSRAQGLRVTRPMSTRTAFTPLQGDWQAFEATMSSSIRSDTRRQRRRLEALGAVTIEDLSPDEDRVERCLEDLIRVEAAGWKSRAGTAIAQDPRMRRFYLGYGRVAARLGTLRIFLLKVGGETIAAQMNIEHGSRLWCLKIGFDEGWAKYSPGTLLNHHALRHGCERGLEGYEYLGAVEAWQRRWPVEVREHSTLRFYPATPRGGVAFTADVVDFLSRRVNRAAQSTRHGSLQVERSAA